MTDEVDSQRASSAESPSERPMHEEPELSNPPKARWKRRVTLVSVAIILIAACIVLPPLVNISRYQRQITALMSRSLGRQVRLSGVELRLLPRPGFVLHDLSVSEDPAFGAEPILRAQTVVAAIRIDSLWQGRLMVSRISVDEASLNLVRSPQGRWNLQSLMMGGLIGGINGAQSKFARKQGTFPYLEATNSRVNLKNGVEKSPFSIVAAELSLWRDDPGVWRLRLRGQPSRTDMEMSSADTGDVQAEASLDTRSPVGQPARTLDEMPLKLQVEWRDAQLGQLSRLLLGSDAGWRGDLTADMEVQGTANAAQTRTRVRATGVRREEFSPETPLDFDANCSFLYRRHPQKAVRDLGCDTVVGDGRLHLKADLPGDSGKPEAMLEVKQLPLQAALDLLRTLRRGFAPGISVIGAANGSLSLVSVAPATKKASHSSLQRSRLAGKDEPATGEQNLQGSLTVDGAQLKGGSLKEPILLPKMTWTPVRFPNSAPGNGFETALGSHFMVSLGSISTTEPPAPTNGSPAPSKPHPAPAVSRPQEITVRLGLTSDGYQAAFDGWTGIITLRDLAYALGAPHLGGADSFRAGSTDIQLIAAGPWIDSTDPSIYPASPPSATTSASPQLPAATPPPTLNPSLRSDSFTGSLQIHHAQWQAPYLTHTVEMPQGTLVISGNTASMTSDFTYGPLKGSLMAQEALHCSSNDCQPQLQLRLGALDANVVEATLLGVPEKKSLLSPLIDRMRSSDRPTWPTVTIDAQADSLLLGPANLSKPSFHLKIAQNEIVLDHWETALLGGSAKGQGSVSWTDNGPDNGPMYEIEGDFTQISPSALGAILAGNPDNLWTGGPLNGTGKIQLSGLTATQLSASANGNVNFIWPHGSVPALSPANEAIKTAPALMPTPVQFDNWTGIVTIANEKVKLGENTMRLRRRNTSVTGAMPFGGPAALILDSASSGGGKTDTAANSAAKPPAVQ